MTLSIGQIKSWYCPNCPMEERTTSPKPHTPLHPCKAMFGLAAPYILKGVKAHVYSVERQDYVGNENVRLDGRGRPVMSIITERDNGQDCVVFAPTASVRASTGY